MEKNYYSLPTYKFRSEHREIQKHLAHIQTWSNELLQQQADTQLVTMRKIVSFLSEQIKPHAAWEETYLYPLIDKLTSSSKAYAFTSSMQHEHKIISRWIDDLDKNARALRPDPASFVQSTNQLLGIIKAHFEEEDEVLLPIIDQNMTAKDFQRKMQAPPEQLK